MIVLCKPNAFSIPDGRTARILAAVLALFILGLLSASTSAYTSVYCPHVTGAYGWKTSLGIYNSAYYDTTVGITKINSDGSDHGEDIVETVRAKSWLIIPSSSLQYEGSLNVFSLDNLLVKSMYQSGDSPSVCEFFLPDRVATTWVLPNSPLPWFQYAALAMMNPNNTSVTVTFEAWKNGAKVHSDRNITLTKGEKYVAMSSDIWPGVNYTDLDTIIVRASQPVTAPMSITGNLAGDRHLFFLAQDNPIAKAFAEESFFTVGDTWTDLPGEPPNERPRAETLSSTSIWCSHVTNSYGWKTWVSIYNPSDYPTTYSAVFFNAAGTASPYTINANLPPRVWTSVPLGAHEGTVRIGSPIDVMIKSGYQCGSSPSVCEFALRGDTAQIWVIPNEECFDTIVIRSSSHIPAPINITGNLAGDRHLFFPAQFELANFAAGRQVFGYQVVGGLRFIPKGLFNQGSPSIEPGRSVGVEDQFAHFLTRNFAAMEYEVTRYMWTILRNDQPSLPPDPSQAWPGDNNAYHPVQRVTWNEAILFANLLSVNNGFQRCYFTDAAHQYPVDAGNYTSSTIYCDFDATGYRLPTEGEWERMARGGTTTTFSFAEPNYTPSTASTCSPSPDLTGLDGAAWWCGNSSQRTALAGTKSGNPYNLKDVHGNVLEWCWDWYVAQNPTTSQVDFTGPVSGTYRDVRGGSYAASAYRCRSAKRGYCLPLYRLQEVGFRLVRTLP